MDGESPLFPKYSGEFYYANKRFSDQALDFICCCALFTTLNTVAVSWFFQGETTSNRDLFDVQASEIRGCFYKMVDNNHPIYLQWSRTHPLDNRRAIEYILEPLEHAEMSFGFQYEWHRQRQAAIPNWSRLD